MTKYSESFHRFDKPGATRDFTNTQFELIQLSHEWEKLRDQSERERDAEEADPLQVTVEKTIIRTLTPTTVEVSEPSPMNERPVSDIG